MEPLEPRYMVKENLIIAFTSYVSPKLEVKFQEVACHHNKENILKLANACDPNSDLTQTLFTNINFQIKGLVKMKKKKNG